MEDLPPGSNLPQVVVVCGLHCLLSIVVGCNIYPIQNELLKHTVHNVDFMSWSGDIVNVGELSKVLPTNTTPFLSSL